jgi:hypothetical protein
MEAAGNATEANKLIVLPEDWARFRDRPAFVLNKKPDSLSETEYQIVQALGALVQFELVSCESTFFGTVANIRFIRPDVERLFPNRTEGVAIRTPRDNKERNQWIAALHSRFGDLSKITMVTEIYPLPIVETNSGAKVGLSRF